MRTFVTFAAALSMAALAWGFQPPTSSTGKKAPVKKAASKPGVKKSGTTTASSRTASTRTGSKSATARTAGSKSGAGKTSSLIHTASAKNPGRKAPVKRTTWRNRQATPSPERYREIQNALVAKGYLPADSATGTWDQGSSEALKKFQTEQNIDSSGKINSLSLIALGLGPRHDAAKPLEGGNNNNN